MSQGYYELTDEAMEQAILSLSLTKSYIQVVHQTQDSRHATTAEQA